MEAIEELVDKVVS